MLTSDFVEGLEIVAKAHNDFLMIGQRWDTEINEPWDFSRPDWAQKLRSLALQPASGLMSARIRVAGSPASGRIPELDGLRGIAISLVVVFHYFYFSPAPGYHPVGLVRNAYLYAERFFALGWTGVDLFFVISGFLIGGILLDVRNSTRYFKTFYLRRLYRIIPIYYAWIGTYVLLIIFGSSFLRTHAMGDPVPEARHQVFVQFLFLQNFGLKYAALIANAWFLPTWSLAVEEQFYLIAPLVIRFVAKRRLYVLLGTVILTAPALRVWIHYHLPVTYPNLSLAYTLMPCRADALAIGILAAILWRNRDFQLWLSKHGLLLYTLAGIFLAGAVAFGGRFSSQDSLLTQSVGYTWIAVFYAVVLVLALARSAGPVARISRLRWLGEIGRVSYCLYLIHVAVRLGWGILIRSVLPHAQTWQLVAWDGVAAIIAYVISRASWRYFEHPLLRRGHAYHY